MYIVSMYTMYKDKKKKLYTMYIEKRENMTFDKKKYDQKYAKENYDRVLFNVRKGDKDVIVKQAKEKGFKTMADYIKSLVYADIEKSQNAKNINVQNILQNGDNNNISIG